MLTLPFDTFPFKGTAAEVIPQIMDLYACAESEAAMAWLVREVTLLRSESQGRRIAAINADHLKYGGHHS